MRWLRDIPTLTAPHLAGVWGLVATILCAWYACVGSVFGAELPLCHAINLCNQKKNLIIGPNKRLEKIVNVRLDCVLRADTELAGCSSRTLVCSFLSLFRFLLCDRCFRLCMASLKHARACVCVCVYWVVLKAQALKKAVTNRTTSGSSVPRVVIPALLLQPYSATDSWLGYQPTLSSSITR